MDDLIAQIEAAFIARQHPGDDNITRCSYDKKNGGRFEGACFECADMAAFFQGRTWKELTAAEMRREGSTDSLFTIPAYCYFLPAFLIAAIRDPEEADVCLDHLRFRFGPTSDDVYGQERLTQILAELTADERAAARAYFHFELVRHDDYGGYCERSITTLGG